MAVGIGITRRGILVSVRIAGNRSSVVSDATAVRSENITEQTQAWRFDLWQETIRLIDVIAEAASRDGSLGEAVGRVIEEERYSHCNLSIAATGYRIGLPVTSHVSIDSDITHAMPNFNGAALGKTSYTDFLITLRRCQAFADSVV